MRRYIITGAPGAGKTTLVAALRAKGYAAVDEAATDVIAREQAMGCDEPWHEDGFADAIVRLQRMRQERPAPPGTAVQVYDRSPICTYALANYAETPVSPTLAAEVDHAVRNGIYRSPVFLVHLLGFITPTAARRISYPDSVRFERFHVDAYREYGFELVDVPAGPVEERVALVESHIRAGTG